MSAELQIAILGVVGTLLGTLVGWFLNNLSKHGKLDAFISSWTDTFQYNNCGYMAQSTSIKQTEYYRYDLNVDLYNGGGDTKIMRNIEIVFADEQRTLKISVPHDEATKVFGSPSFHYCNVEPINIPPKAVIKCMLMNGFSNENNELDFLWQTTRIYLCYTDEKRKVRSVPIKVEVYKNYFETHKQGEPNNA